MKSIQEAVASVQNAFPSIYTKDDVIKLLESIEAPKEAVPTHDLLKRLVDDAFKAISSNIHRLDSSDIVEEGSAEFNIRYGNTVELSSVDINHDTILEEVENGLKETLDEYIETLQPVKDDVTQN